MGKVSYHVEFYNPETNTSCKHKRLPIDRIDHTSVEGVLCGGLGKEAKTSCVDMSSGKWSSKKYSPIRPRTGHVSWNLNPGESFMLLGGAYYHDESKKSTDVVYLNGTVEPGFNLPYETR